jgi:hypothetical protein
MTRDPSVPQTLNITTKFHKSAFAYPLLIRLPFFARIVTLVPFHNRILARNQLLD